MSHFSSGARDLGLRDRYMGRSLFHLWVQACECCYVAARLDASPPEPELVVAAMDDPRWHLLLALGSEAPVVSALLRLSLLDLAQNRLAAASLAALRAAWAAEDNGLPCLAEDCRKEAASILDLELRCERLDPRRRQDAMLLRIDLLRRVHEWARAQEPGVSMQAQATGHARDVLLRQLSLIEVRDCGAHPLPNARPYSGLAFLTSPPRHSPRSSGR